MTTEIPKVARAAILTEQKKPLVVDEIELPKTLDVGQVLVEVVYSGICGSQLGEIDGVKGDDPYLPHLLGHEGSGKVIAIGAGVETVKPGDHVVMHWRPGTGIQGKPPHYKWRGERLNAGFVTTFNDFAITSENRLTAIPKTFDLAAAALLGCAVLTGAGVIRNDAQVTMGDSVVVWGAGGVGYNMIQAARMSSAYPVIAIDLFDEKLAMAKKFGATHTFNAKKEDSVFDRVSEILDGKGADVVIDNTGIPDIIEQAYNLSKPKGKTILVGVPKKGNTISIYSLPLHFGKVLKGSHGGGANPQEDIIRYLGLINQGMMEIDSLITARVPLTEINSAIASIKSGHIIGRCLVDMS